MGVIVLDSSALLNTRFSFEKSHRYYCPNAVLEELKSPEARLLAENALSQDLLTVLDACPLSIQAANRLADKTGTSRLSRTDLAVFALVLELRQEGKKPRVWTDDYSLQNLLKHEKIPFKGVLHPKIKKARTFGKKPIQKNIN